MKIHWTFLEMGQAVNIYAKFLIPDHVFMDSTLHPLSRLESEHVNSFISNELLVGKKLHRQIRWLHCDFSWRSWKPSSFSMCRVMRSCFFAWISSFYLCTKLEDEFFSNHGRMMLDKDTGELRRYGYIIILAYVKYFYNVLSS